MCCYLPTIYLAIAKLPNIGQWDFSKINRAITSNEVKLKLTYVKDFFSISIEKLAKHEWSHADVILRNISQD